MEGVAFRNCDYGCPCQFERWPTQGHCRGFEVVRIDKGHFGDVPLDGLHLALLYAWLGCIFEGGGTMQAIIDERANERRREALVTVVHGGGTCRHVAHSLKLEGSTAYPNMPVLCCSCAVLSRRKPVFGLGFGPSMLRLSRSDRTRSHPEISG